MRLRRWPLLVVAVGIQLSLGWLPAPARWLLVLVCCALAAAWLYVNVGAFGTNVGLALLFGGILANTIVIAANQGMPVDVHALVLSGRAAHTDLANGYLFKHTRMNAHTSLAWLGDRLPLPVLKEVLSFGDLLMLGGLATIAYRATRPHPLRLRTRLGPPRTVTRGSAVLALDMEHPIVCNGSGVQTDLGHLRT